MDFSSIQATSLVDQVEDRIRSVIQDSDLKAGDSLPGEIELSNRMGVSRNVVREALSRLQSLGILESRKRRGIIIAEPDILAGMAKVIDLPIFGEASQRELVEFRLIIELGVSEIIMLHKSPEGLRKLEKIVRREEKDPANQLLGTECDLAFHSTLLEMVGNSTLKRFQTLLVRFFEWSVTNMQVLPDRFENSEMVSHRDLLELLRADDAEGFHNAMRKHLATHRHVLQAQFMAQQREDPKADRFHA
ncbi:MAG: GntR family transcriptional regulator [Candidatus Sumerlaeota bacterium]